MRVLELNEGQAQHSRYEPGTVLTGDYWDGFLTMPFAALDRPPRRMAILGNAGGTTARAYARLFPGTWIDGVEIDAELSEIGRRYFHMRNPRLRLHHEDARPFLRQTDTRYDVIALDTYRQPYIPFYLSTVEFFELAHDRLAPGGVVVVNVGHPEGQDGLEKVLTATMGEAFRHVARDPIEDTNTILAASDGEVSADAAASRGPLAAERAAPDGARGGGPDRGPAPRRQRLHGRPRAGRVADRRVDRGLRGRRLITSVRRRPSRRLPHGPGRPAPRSAPGRRGGTSACSPILTRLLSTGCGSTSGCSPLLGRRSTVSRADRAPGSARRSPCSCSSTSIAAVPSAARSRRPSRTSAAPGRTLASDATVQLSDLLGTRASAPSP